MFKKILLGLAAFFVLIQLVPFGRDHTNPPVTGEPAWDFPETKALFDRACADCHSHGTVWPWYASVAPVSWLVQHDVDEGREHFNVSAWGSQKKNKGDEAAEEVREGEMPPFVYLPTHPEARLTDGEKAALVKGLAATFGDEGEEGEHEH